MYYFDCHCDTVFRMEKEHLPFSSPRLHIHSEACRAFRGGVQLFALWADAEKSAAECWCFVRNALAKYRGFPFLPNNIKGFFTIEDARILEGDLARLRFLKQAGVVSCIPFWRGENEFGGAWDTEIPLSPFGRKAILACISMKILPDISHASLPAAEEILFLARKAHFPVLASHVCARALCDHGRNLPKEFLLAVSQSGGLVGLDFVPDHLTRSDKANLSHIAAHLEYFFSLGMQKACCFGCDFDGCDSLPQNIRGLASFPSLYSYLLRHGFSEESLRRIFYQNGFHFAKRFIHPLI